MQLDAARRTSRRALAATLVAAVSLSTVVALTAPAMSVAPGTGRHLATHRRDVPFDSRAQGAAVGVGRRVAEARRLLGERLGSQGVIASDRVTGTLRYVGRLDGFLTGASARSPATIALDYVRANLTAFGLSRADVRTLSLREDYVDVWGTHHLSWIQRWRGLPVFGNGLKANVAEDGRLINVSGSPVSGLHPNVTIPRVSSSTAIVAARAGAGARGGSVDRRDSAELGLFATGRGARLAWRTITFVSSQQIDLSVVDALTGQRLSRTNLVKSDTTGTGSAWALTASDGVSGGGGTAAPVTFPVADGTKLAGNNAHAWADVNDDGVAQSSEEVAAQSGLDWSYAPALNSSAGFNCSTLRPCSWDPTVPFSWQANLPHNVEQVYYFLNTFHDHLLAPPIGFTEAAGNFQLVNPSGQGEGGDPVQGQAMDGANTDNGFPDIDHVDNANMTTFPDGKAPIMQMYLLVEVPGSPPWPAANGGDDAEVVYHEYTHGLSNRLITTPDGFGAVKSAQSAAMGEGWSDWYAIDFLNGRGYKPDAAGDGNLVMGYYTFSGLLRRSSVDCPVGSSSSSCGTPSAGTGGYTYGDFGRVVDGPEVHADGEIWLQTLWQLRDTLGQSTTQGLITRAMELSPPEPTFLDMRNSIMQADLIGNAGANQDAIWGVFAERGMGYFASAFDGNDIEPAEDFSLPPDCAVDPCGAIRGRVINKVTGEPLGKARVFVVGLASGFGSDLGTTTASDGTFRIDGIPFHDAYEAIAIVRKGYERRVIRNVVVDGVEKLDAKMNRDWAALEAGARLVSASPPDYTEFGCGPANAFDLSAAGWGSDAPKSRFGSNVTGPRKAVVRLPKAVNVTSFGVASNGTCGDPPRAAVKAFTIQTRTQNGDWITVVKANAKNDGVLRTYPPEGSGGLRKVRSIRFIMRSTHGDRVFMDVVEVTVRGR